MYNKQTTENQGLISKYARNGTAAALGIAAGLMAPLASANAQQPTPSIQGANVEWVDVGNCFGSSYSNQQNNTLTLNQPITQDCMTLIGNGAVLFSAESIDDFVNGNANQHPIGQMSFDLCQQPTVQIGVGRYNSSSNTMIVFGVASQIAYNSDCQTPVVIPAATPAAYQRDDGQYMLNGLVAELGEGIVLEDGFYKCILPGMDPQPSIHIEPVFDDDYSVDCKLPLPSRSDRTDNGSPGPTTTPGGNGGGPSGDHNRSDNGSNNGVR